MLFVYKLSAAVIILLVSVTAGVLTTRINQVTWRFHFAETLASGIFLGAAMFHMLPDAEKNFSIYSNLSSYPWAQLLCVFSVMMLLWVEQILSKNHQHNLATSARQIPYMPITVLSLHSILEGAALGINLSTGEAFMILLAILAHKGLDSFALCTSMQRSVLTAKHSKMILLTFSLMTPLGIILASSAILLLQSHMAQLFQAIFNALGAGVFIYLAITHRINHYLYEQEDLHSLHYLLAVSAGLFVMAALAIWI